MRRTTVLAKVIVATGGLGLLACSSILGSFEVTSAVSDGGAPDGATDAGDGGTGTLGPAFELRKGVASLVDNEVILEIACNAETKAVEEVRLRNTDSVPLNAFVVVSASANALTRGPDGGAVQGGPPVGLNTTKELLVYPNGASQTGIKVAGEAALPFGAAPLPPATPVGLVADSQPQVIRLGVSKNKPVEEIKSFLANQGGQPDISWKTVALRRRATGASLSIVSDGGLLDAGASDAGSGDTVRVDLGDVVAGTSKSPVEITFQGTGNNDPSAIVWKTSGAVMTMTDGGTGGGTDGGATGVTFTLESPKELAMPKPSGTATAKATLTAVAASTAQVGTYAQVFELDTSVKGVCAGTGPTKLQVQLRVVAFAPQDGGTSDSGAGSDASDGG